jgi:pre-mRNA 3'-end-processing factor FIP1
MPSDNEQEDDGDDLYSDADAEKTEAVKKEAGGSSDDEPMDEGADSGDEDDDDDSDDDSESDIEIIIDKPPTAPKPAAYLLTDPSYTGLSQLTERPAPSSRKSQRQSRSNNHHSRPPHRHSHRG